MMNENFFHVIKDPVHGTMQFTMAENNWIKPFIDSPAFQRLRYIKQLGMADFIFPGAVHTRFNHCIGCCYIGSQIAHKIGLAEEERQLVMIACLLHDIGHGPFSHAFEDIFHEKMIRHEEWTPFFLKQFRQETFFAEYNKRNPRHGLTEEKFALIEAMIMHKKTNNRVIADIVSSQLDADRLDYLLRDSHFCGVTYGQFDFRWILHCLAIVKTGDGERLGLTNKGIGGIEHYLVARRLMTKNIYHHSKKLALEYFLVQLLKHLSESIDSDPTFDPIKNSPIGQFLLAVKQFNRNLPKKKDLTQHKQLFLTQNYDNYKELGDYDIFSAIKLLASIESHHPAVKIAHRLHHRKMPALFRVDQNEKLMTEFLNFKKNHTNDFQDWQLHLFKLPHQSYNIKADPILIINEGGKIRPLNELSILIEAISDKSENTSLLCIDAEILEHPSIQQLTRAFLD